MLESRDIVDINCLSEYHALQTAELDTLEVNNIIPDDLVVSVHACLLIKFELFDFFHIHRKVF